MTNISREGIGVSFKEVNNRYLTHSHCCCKISPRIKLLVPPKYLHSYELRFPQALVLYGIDCRCTTDTAQPVTPLRAIFTLHRSDQSFSFWHFAEPHVVDDELLLFSFNVRNYALLLQKADKNLTFFAAIFS